ncbi:MAG: adenylate/guanylate cyclase domain-containing protein [Spirochaetia bacterium]|nr:adenylate/guanylate cyclase domain-containing protein [Spirochaetia bacterium]
MSFRDHSILRFIIGRRVKGTRIVPVTLKITFIFAVIILASNLSSNYINLMLNRAELNSLLRQLLVKDLRDLNTFCNNQYEIFEFLGDEEGSIKGIEEKALYELDKGKGGIFLGIKRSGEILFKAASDKEIKISKFSDRPLLDSMFSGVGEGYQPINFNGQSYLTVYKYNRNWDVILLLAVAESDFYAQQRLNYIFISAVILIIALVSAVVGIFLFRYILQFIHIITDGIMRMIDNQKLELINLKEAPNDDITYMGMAFNSLASTVENLLTIFRKFTNKDIVVKAYREEPIGLEGVQKELTVLFSDIKGFTNITETLGTDIIKLLNLHYDRAIRKIQDLDGIISAIIGDALLAVFGINLHEDKDYEIINKSYQAVQAAYRVQEVAKLLRQEMQQKKEEIVRSRGELNREELKVFRAVLLEVGVGIDGGDVFYGTIGSHVRMTNTVIGDRVNSSSRLEGLTRVYRIPVICSEYVKNDIEKNIVNHGIHFLEMDTVQVKGKTIGTKIYFPVPEQYFSERLEKEIREYQIGLDYYYRGDWPTAYSYFKNLRFKPARV